MKPLFGLGSGCLAVIGAACLAEAQTTLTFDALLPGSDWQPIQSGYGGLQWNNFGVFAGASRPQREGYRTGTVSLRNIAFNPNGEPASIQRSTPFTLNSASLTAAFVDGLQVRIQGFVGGSAAYDNTYTLKVAAPALLQLNYAGVDRVTFTASPESQFVMDDLIVTVAVTNGPCAFALSAADGIHSGASQTGSVSVATSPGCAWTVSNTTPWISILSSLNNTNSRTVTYQVETNSTGLPRSSFIQIADQLFAVRQSGAPLSTDPVDLGRVEVSTLGHSFTVPPYRHPGVPGDNTASDSLLDQDQSSGGGGVLPSVSINWDTHDQFALTVLAPAGKRFFVHVPAGRQARFGGFLWWNSAGRGGISPPGPVAVSFERLEGTPPDFSESDAVLSDAHGFFGFVDIDSTPFTNDLRFASLTITGTVAPQQTGMGVLTFAPHAESALSLIYTLSETNDPGPFVSLVPDDLPASLRALLNPPAMKISTATNGDITITFSGALQSANNLNGPFETLAGEPQGTFTIPKASQITQQYFRAKGNR